MRILTYLISVLIVVLFSCRSEKKGPTLFELVPDTGINFINNVEDGPVENSFLFRNFYNGGGVAIGDINNDGLADVMLTSNMGDNKLYLNKGSFKFEDISVSAGLQQDSAWCTGVTFADINNDGWLDIYVCSSGHMSTGRRKNKLYINDQRLGFTEQASSYGLDIVGYCTQVSFFDYDLDKDLDMFLINNSPIPVNQLGYANRRELPEAEWPVADFLKGGGDHLYRNEGGKFTEVTKESGIHGSLISFGLGVTVGDINEDGYPDVYVANDSYERDYLYINQKDGTFRDEFEACMQHTSMSSMGADLADINNDGHPDIFTTDMLPGDEYRLKTLGSFDNIDLYRSKVKSGFHHQFMQNCLQVNNGNNRFYETAFYSGVAATDWSWGALLFDLDNDGLNDIFVCNGVKKDVTNLDFMDFFANDVIQKMILSGKKEGFQEVLKEIPVNPQPNKVFRNTGNLKFADAADLWGFTEKSFSNGAAYGDLDNDGDLDLVINNVSESAFIYRNNSREQSKNNFMGLSLKGAEGNHFAIGSKVKLYIGDEVLSRELIPCRGFQSSMDYKIIIGLGTAQQVDSMEITWPGRAISRFYQPAVNTLHVVSEADEKKFPGAKQSTRVGSQPAFLNRVQAPFNKHLENDVVDFYYERNLPEMLSREGPKGTKADVDGDGLEDLYIGGAAGQGGRLYLQTKGGEFVEKHVKAFDQYKDFEDVAVLFFDCDQDGDPDLLLCPGGNDAPPNTREIQLRLFKNDGKGNFDIETTAFPNNNMNISVAAACDFNHDGSLDLFVGGRSVPRNYGVTPSSYLFVNDGKGNFTDIAKDRNPDIANIGMVTGATWSDLTGDQKEELIVVGQWMAPRIFSFSGNRFVEIKSSLSELKGWWQTVVTADFNKDGRQDLMLGNIGENFYLQPDQKNPVKLWITDFNKNGSLDKILTRTVEGKDMPVFLKHELQDQVPSIKKGNLKHREYATKSIQDLFLPELLANSTVKEFNFASSCVAINNRNGKFTVQELPLMVQLSSVNAAKATDINQDGFVDLVLGGNNFGFLPQLGRLDASLGDVLINNGKGDFRWAGSRTSGLDLTGVVRDILELKVKGSNALLFLRNNDYPVLYQVNNISK